MSLRWVWQDANRPLSDTFHYIVELHVKILILFYKSAPYFNIYLHQIYKSDTYIYIWYRYINLAHIYISGSDIYINRINVYKSDLVHINQADI